MKGTKHDKDRELGQTAAVTLLDAAPVGVLVLDRDGRVVWSNPAMDDFLGMDVASTFPPDVSVRAPLGWLFETEDMVYVRPESARPGRWLKVCRRPLDHDGDTVAWYFTDITDEQQIRTERNQLAQQLSELTTRDSLTGLANRRGLLQQLEPLVSRSRRYGNPLAIIRLDTDDPARLDRDHGAAAGQTAMAAVSRTLRDQLRWTDLIGRLDAGKFLLVLPETGSGAARELVDKIAAHLSDLSLRDANDRPLTLTLCYAVTEWQKGDDARRLLDRAAQLIEAAAARPDKIATG